MPAKGKTIRPQHTIDEAVKRYLAGESAAVLAKYYKISKPGFYLWVAKYKQELLKNADRAHMSPKDADLVDKRVLLTELEAMRVENRKLRDKVVTLMMKAGEM